MKIAISTDSGQVSAHFGRCPEFTIAVIEDGRLASQDAVPNPGHSPGLIPDFLSKKGVQAIVCGGMGMRAQNLFAEKGIRMLLGVTGSVQQAIEGLIDGSLEGGESLCQPGAGKGYGIDKTVCDHPEDGGDADVRV
jgi:predicted Fe-Mo cluster-binding NifX family protein